MDRDCLKASGEKADLGAEERQQGAWRWVDGFARAWQDAARWGLNPLFAKVRAPGGVVGLAAAQQA
jgi:hypothetical protein